MTCVATDCVNSAVLAAARARPPRRRPAQKKIEKAANNYIAEARRPGAPRGNQNARTHGRRCRRFVALRRMSRILIAAARANCVLLRLPQCGGR
jgi:hypothetical protein